MVVTLNLQTDVYSLPDKSGKQKLIKKNLIFKKTFETNNIQIEHYIDTKGNISKKYTMIYEADKGYKAMHKFEELERLIKPIKIRGFII